MQRQVEEGVELIQNKPLTEQITPLVQRQVEEEEAFQQDRIGGGCCFCMDAGLSGGIAGSDDCAFEGGRRC